MAVPQRSVTSAGVFWTCLSLSAALLCCVGFWLPYWLVGPSDEGRNEDHRETFSPWRRCNYPAQDGGGTVVRQCGRYTSWGDLPSAWWQGAVVSGALAAGLALLSAFLSLFGCLLSRVMTRVHARVLGGLQTVAAGLVLLSLALFPYGWSAGDVRRVCGGDVYLLGRCHLGNAVFVLATAVVNLILCSCLSVFASKA